MGSYPIAPEFAFAVGDHPNDFGRIPLGVLLAYEFDASVVVFGTGASQKEYQFGDQSKGILFEAQFACEMLKDHFNELEKFKIFEHRCGTIRDEKTREAIKEKFLKNLVLDVESKTTDREIERAGQEFVKHKVNHVILVSSPTHIVRCLRDAMTIYHADTQFASFRDNVTAVPSITCYDGTSAKDVVIIEPPHRPDRHVIPTHRRMQRMLTLHKLPYEELVRLIEEFDDLLQRYENKYFKLKK